MEGIALLLPIMLIALIALMFWQSSRQRAAMRKMQEMQDSLVPGDRVLTTSGLQATVTSVEEKTVVLEIAPGVSTTWDRRVIREKVSADGTAPGDPGESTADKQHGE